MARLIPAEDGAIAPRHRRRLVCPATALKLGISKG